jgi:D-alanyl-D-alanine carboxypeptidase
LKLGEEMTLGNMLYGLMLRSGNDAATAIAEHVGGSLDGFAYLMNQEARFIGMPNSSFKNPSGLDEDGHRASANDMARLTAHALKNPVFQEIVKTKVKKAPNPNESWDYTWLNKNKMLSMYEGADGVKTGYTKLAKRCLVSSATRNGQQLAVVTLNDGDDWADHARLFDYGFKNFPHTKVIGKGDKIQGSNAVAGTTFNYPTASEEAGGFTTQAVWTDSSTAQYRLGERGKLIVYLAKNQIGQVPLYDAGSPAMKGVAESAFGVKDDDSFSSTAAQIFALVRALARALFTGVTG